MPGKVGEAGPGDRVPAGGRPCEGSLRMATAGGIEAELGARAIVRRALAVIDTTLD